MNDADEIKEVLLNILQIGLLRIRSFGWDGAAKECSIEADHLHNLPTLIQLPSIARLLYYYNIERTGFLKRASNADMFKSHWERLAKLIDAMRTSA
ncbi:MAG: hypothetical protein WCE73_16565 [Candidatus Angelobacter sp.]